MAALPASGVQLDDADLLALDAYVNGNVSPDDVKPFALIRARKKPTRYTERAELLSRRIGAS